MSLRLVTSALVSTRPIPVAYPGGGAFRSTRVASYLIRSRARDRIKIGRQARFEVGSGPQLQWRVAYAVSRLAAAGAAALLRLEGLDEVG